MTTKDPYALTKWGADVKAGIELLAENPHLAPRFSIGAGWDATEKTNPDAGLLEQAILSAYPHHTGLSFGATLRFIGQEAREKLGRNIQCHQNPEDSKRDYFLIEAARPA